MQTIDRDEQTEVEPVGYRLVLVVAGPNYRDIVELESQDRLDLSPTFHDINGLVYERYTGEHEHEYVEIRFDYVVSREIEAVFPPTPTPDPAPVEPDEGLSRPAEERVSRREE